MRIVGVCLVLLVFFGCKSKRAVVSELTNKEEIMSCPEGGICSFQVETNKKLALKTDQTGMLYPDITEGQDILLKYIYEKETDANIQDASYQEAVYINLKKEQLNLQAESLKPFNIVFARLCFCKGESGYFRVKNGRIKVETLRENSYRLVLKFQAEGIPQVINEINQVFRLP
ncbi:hypothetical protein [Aestuariibaculum sediminum]|uniref:Lipoprotein n=1 Tax=Aestuariibaculum sediminum TaxID=2770637 RepID=A0A8J6Q1Z4_9FLAO|nr:hypothetical protein [Aestuariibaculum sediminum]MBD0831439.1 hypothetical protein [Aestuariibaculum sediminum]